jgi:K+-sensing histidine kinase KdpD
MVEKHDGEIRIEDDDTGGAHFVIELARDADDRGREG